MMSQKQTILGLSVHVFLFFKGVLLITDQLVYPENDHFYLKLYILISLCQIFSNKLPLKLMSQYFEDFWSFFGAFEISIKPKIRWKTMHWTNFWQYRWTKQFFKKSGTHFYYHFSALWNKPFTQFLLFMVVEL